MAGDLKTAPAVSAAVRVPAGSWPAAIRAAGRGLVTLGAADEGYVERCVAQVQADGPYIVVAPGIALAHARPEDGARALGVAVAVLDRPVNFEHPVNDPVDVVFAFCSPDRDAHVGLLAALARQLGSGLADRLRAAPDDAAATTLLREVIDMVDIAAHNGVVTAAGFGAAMRDHLERVEAANAATLDRVADRMLEVVRRDGLIYVTGTGHSIGTVLETFYRAGGLACVRPLYHASLLPLNGGQESTLCEHLPGLARLMVGHCRPGPDDLGIVVSNSGINAVPVELAEELTRHGTPVVAIVSLVHLRQADARVGRKLDSAAEYVVDTVVPYGDAAYPAGDGVTAAGMSSLTNVYLWNLLLTRLIDRARAAGVTLPIWTSSNVAGGEERNAGLFARFGPRVPAL